MSKLYRTAALTAGLLLGACASITEGDHQNLTLNTNPEGARCTLTRHGETIGAVTTPGQLVVQKTKYDIDVLCTKAGYEDARGFIKSDIEAMTLGNLAFGGLVGWAVDSANGADNKYQEVNVVTLTPKPQSATAAAPMTAAPVLPAPAAPARMASVSRPLPMPGPDACSTGSSDPAIRPTLASASASGPLPSVVEFKPAPIATRICLDTGGYIQVTSLSGTTVDTINAARHESEWVGLFFVPANPALQFDRTTAESIWPLEIGKSVSFKMTGTGANGSAGEWQETITVIRQEELTTEAGQFRTMVVETREQSLTGPFQAVSTRWYAPDVGFVVKYRRVIEQGAGNESAWTASKIMTPGG